MKFSEGVIWCCVCCVCVVCMLLWSLWYVRMHSYNASAYVRVRVYMCVHVCILCEWMRMCECVWLWVYVCVCVCVWYQLYITIELVRISKIRPIWKVKWGWFKHCPAFETNCDSSFLLFRAVYDTVKSGQKLCECVCVCVCVCAWVCVFFFIWCVFLSYFTWKQCLGHQRRQSRVTD